MYEYPSVALLLLAVSACIFASCAGSFIGLSALSAWLHGRRPYMQSIVTILVVVGAPMLRHLMVVAINAPLAITDHRWNIVSVYSPADSAAALSGVAMICALFFVAAATRRIREFFDLLPKEGPRFYLSRG